MVPGTVRAKTDIGCTLRDSPCPEAIANDNNFREVLQLSDTFASGKHEIYYSNSKKPV